jgi:GTP 3',8-cyclase
MNRNQGLAGAYDTVVGRWGVNELTAKDSPGLVDSFGRRITYVRLSVTDRCDLRCRYCMAERMQFLPKREILTFEEIIELSDILIDRGVRKIRLTGGEPLVRKGIMELVRSLGRRIGGGLDELVLTTNGTRLAQFADELHDAGIRRINVSLDSRDPQRFAHITRGGNLDQVLAGIDAARRAGLSVKINTVALAGVNEDEIADMLPWCAGMGMDLTLIETMPLGEVEEDRTAHYLPLDVVKRRLEQQFTLVPSMRRTGGPSRYFEVPELGGRVGFITPLSNNFCDGCNRIRIAATGTVYGCLGHDQKVELRDAIRTGGADCVNLLLDRLLAGKPRRHEFRIGGEPAVARHMSVTGG